MSPPRNFVITIVDSLRSDLFLEGEEGKPNFANNLEYNSLHDLKKSGVFLPELHTTQLLPAPAAASLLTGLYPREHGLYGRNENLNPDRKSLVEFFSDAGYRTILFNGHGSYSKNGMMNRFDENSLGPIERLIWKIRKYNKEGIPVFVLYENLDLRAPYLLSKFPSDKSYHDLALQRLNEISDTIGLNKTFNKNDVECPTSEWQVQYAGYEELPGWRLMMDTVHHHFERDEIQLFEDPVKMLEIFYYETLDLLDSYFFDTLNQFLTEDTIGQNTSVLLTSNAGDGETVRNGVATFGQGNKPREDLVRVPGLFFNTRFTDESVDKNLSSHVDIAPTVLNEFEIDYDPEIFSGRSLLSDKSEGDSSIYVESTQGTDSGSSESASSKTGNSSTLIRWQSVLLSDGKKLNQYGQPVTPEDLQLPLEEFIECLARKVLIQEFSSEEIEQRVQSFGEQDSLESRKSLIQQLQASSRHNELELYDWRNDFLEKRDFLKENPDKYDEEAFTIAEKLHRRFPDPDELEKFPEQPVENQGELHYKEPLQAVGYVE